MQQRIWFLVLCGCLGGLVAGGLWFSGEAMVQAHSLVGTSRAPYRPAGSAAAVSAGSYHTCGLHTNGTLACWGDNFSGQAAPPPGLFSRVSTGFFHSCGLRTDGTLACWGDNSFGQAAPPPEIFTSVSGGNYHTCGLRADNTLACWGFNDDGQAAPPPGMFAAVSAGGYHSCGLRADGSLACWGRNSEGQAVPPPGTFTAVSAGRVHTCGLRTDGTLTCWGDNTSGQAAPPRGTFTAVSAGRLHGCALHAGGTLACWGDDSYGQAPQLAITPVVLANGTAGTSYSSQLTITSTLGAAPPYTNTLAAGTLPPALTLTEAGLISGSLTAAGTYTFTIQTVDTQAIAATQSYTVTISDPPATTTTPTGTPTNPPTVAATDTATVTPTAGTATPSATQAGSPPTATVTSCALRFSDVVDPNAYYYAPVYYLACHGVVGGYSDGTFRPFSPTTRAQMAKIVVLAFALPLSTPTDGYTFADVTPGSTFFAYVETVAARGIVSGYSCGGIDPQSGTSEPCDATRRPYYRPGNNVTRGQLTKIVVAGAGWAHHRPVTPSFSDVPADSVFYLYIETAVCHSIISGYSDRTFRPANTATRGQITKISELALTGNPAGCRP